MYAVEGNLVRGIRTTGSFNIRNFDLNLLRLFQALWEHRHITHAAKAIGLTQPAASNALKRLRDSLGDSLFISSQGKMIPTEFAEELASSVLVHLLNIDESLQSKREFDPSTWSRTLRIGVTDYAMATIATRVSPYLYEAAPKGSFQHVVMRDRNPHNELRGGHLDLAIGSFTQDAANFFQAKLHNDSFVVIAAKNHAVFKKKTLTLDAFCASSHCLIAPWGTPRGQIDEKLELLGNSRHIACTVPYFHTVPELVLRTNLVSTVPRSLASFWISQMPISMYDLPKEIDPGEFTIRMLWHERTHESAAHHWVRQFYLNHSGTKMMRRS